MPRQSPRTVLTLLLSGLLLTACAAPAPPRADRSDRELESLRRAQEALAARVDRLQDSLVLVEARLVDQQEALAELQRPALGEAGTGATGQITAPRRPERAPDAPAPEAARPAPADTYLQAFADYAAGRYGEAVAGFGRFLASFPDNAYAGNAQYWLAESYLRQENYPRAAEEFGALVERYPDNSKAPDALLRKAEAERLRGDTLQARETLRRLRALYPDSPAARQSLKSP